MWQSFKTMVEDMEQFREAHPHAVFFPDNEPGTLGARCKEKEWKISAHRLPPLSSTAFYKFFEITGFLQSHLPQD